MLPVKVLTGISIQRARQFAGPATEVANATPTVPWRKADAHKAPQTGCFMKNKYVRLDALWSLPLKEH